MKNGCLFIVLIFLCLFLMCTVKVADKLEKIKPSPCVPLPEPKPIPIIKVPHSDIGLNTKPDVEPVKEQYEPLPEPARIPIVKSLNENKVDQVQSGHWETRVGRGGFLGLRTYKYKVWVNDGSTTDCKDGSCK